MFIRSGELVWRLFYLFLLFLCIDNAWKGGFVLYRHSPRLRLDIRGVYIQYYAIVYCRFFLEWELLQGEDEAGVRGIHGM